MEDDEPTRSQQRAGTRERLVEATIELLSEGGFEAVSIRSVTARAGVNSALVNYYFGTKRELLVEAATTASLRAFEEPGSMLIEAEDPIDGIRAAVGWLANVSGSNPLLPVVAESAVRALRDPDLRTAIGGGLAGFRDRFARRLEAALDKEGSARQIDADGLAVVITALVDGLLIHRLLDPDLDLDAAVSALTAMLEPFGEGP